jgi:hypothetical protein
MGRTNRCAILVALAATSATAHAQSAGIDVQGGLGYARVFDGGGLSFIAALSRSISSRSAALQQAVGVSFWHANTAIASKPQGPDERRLIGLGARYQIGSGACCRKVRPFLALPVHLLRSSIPDRAALMRATQLASEIPTPETRRPIEDQVGVEWGWGAGLELGLELGLGARLSAQTAVQGLYQDIYSSSTRDGAWSWHAGVTYRLQPPRGR